MKAQATKARVSKLSCVPAVCTRSVEVPSTDDELFTRSEVLGGFGQASTLAPVSNREPDCLPDDARTADSQSLPDRRDR